MSHTKGPWSWDVEDLTGQCRLVPGILLTDGTDGTPYGDEIDRANARLIAAAPDLVEFVQQIFNGIDTGMITIDTPADETLANVLSRGRKALSKATGAS